MNGIINDLDFEKRIKDLPDRQLIEFIARQTLEITGKCKQYDKDIDSLKSGDRRASTIAGSVSGTITSILIGIANYLLNRS